MSDDLAVAARDRVRRQRRRTTVAVAAGLTVLASVVSLGWALGGDSQTAAPAADDTTCQRNAVPHP